MKIEISTLIMCLGLSFGACANSLHIQDNANVLSAQMKQNLEDVLKTVENKEGLHIEEVILPNFYNKDPLQVIQAYEQQIEKNAPTITKRVLLLIAMNNQTVAIKPSANISAAFSASKIAEITENITNQLKEKNYDEMARVGVAGVYHYFELKYPGGQLAPKSKLFINLGLLFFSLVMVIGIITFAKKRKTNI